MQYNEMINSASEDVQISQQYKRYFILLVKRVIHVKIIILVKRVIHVKLNGLSTGS